MSLDSLKQMEIPYGHRVKIMKRLREYRPDLPLEEPDADTSVVKSMNQTMRQEMGAGNDEIDTNEEYDEAEQRRLFQEAVNAFRRAAPQTTVEETTEKPKNVKILAV